MSLKKVENIYIKKIGKNIIHEYLQISTSNLNPKITHLTNTHMNMNEY